MARADGPPAMLTTRSGDGTWWAYTGVRVAAATDLTQDREYSRLEPDKRLTKALEQQQSWIDRLLDADAPIDLRYLSAGDGSPVQCAVLTRVHAGDEAALADAAAAAVARLLAGAPNVLVAPLDDRDIHRFLLPFGIGEGGRAEIRKRGDTARPTRPDALSELHWSAPPLRVSPRSWAPLLVALHSEPHPVLLSVALHGRRPDERFPLELDRLASYYKRLGSEGQTGMSLIGSPAKLTPDVFAVDAEKAFSDAARRYRGRTHTFRVAVASPAPLRDGLLGAIAGVLSPPDAADDQAHLTAQRTGSVPAVMRPGPGSVATFDVNLASLGFDVWEPAPVPAFFQAAAPLLRTVDTREATALFRLPVAETGVLPAFPVRRGTGRDVVPAPERAHDPSAIVLGTQLAAGGAGAAVTLPVDDLTMHAFVVGTTGSGKTTSVLYLLDELWRRGIPWMVIEPVNASGDDYRWFLEREGYRDMVVMTAGDDRLAPLRINPFEVPVAVTVGEHLTALLAAFDAAFGLWDPLPAIYRRALEQTYFEAGFHLDEEGDEAGARPWPTVREFTAEMAKVTEGLDYSGEVRSNIIAASQLRAEQLAAGPMRSVFDCRTSTPLEVLLDRPCVIELAKVGASNEQEAAFVMAVLLTRFAELRRGGAPSRALRHVLVVEEAHKLLKKVPQGASSGPDKQGDAGGAAARMFANLLAEIRKYGQAIVVADQDPDKLVADAYKNTNLKLMHRLPAKADRELIGSTMRFEKEHEAEAAGLPRFTAFVHAEGYDRPALVAIPNIRDGEMRELPDDTVVRAHFEALVNAHPDVADSIMPYPECAGCRTVCAHRAWAHATTSRQSVREEFWEIAGEIRAMGPAEADEAWAAAATFAVELARGHRDRAACCAVHFARCSFDSGTAAFAHRYRQELL